MNKELALTDRTRATRDKLLRVARLVFESDGFDLASVSRIVEDADVSRGTFYLYFDSKEAVFRALVDDLQAEILRAQVWPEDLPPGDIVRQATTKFLEFYRDHARFMAVLEQVSAYSPEFRALRLDMRRGTARRALRFISTLQANGQASPTLDARIAGVALTGMTDRLAYIWFVLEEEFDQQQVIDTLTELWMRSVGYDVSATPPPR